MVPATLETWRLVNRRHRRLIFAFLICAALLQAATLTSHRGFFVNWPYGTRPPAAFFANVGGSGNVGPSAPNPFGGRRFFGHHLPKPSGSNPIQPEFPGNDVGSDFALLIANQPASPLLLAPAGEFTGFGFAPGSPSGLGNPVNGPGGAPQIDPTVKAPASVPESSTWIMMLIGFGLIGGALRTRPTRSSDAILYHAAINSPEADPRQS